MSREMYRVFIRELTTNQVLSCPVLANNNYEAAFKAGNNYPTDRYKFLYADQGYLDFDKEVAQEKEEFDEERYYVNVYAKKEKEMFRFPVTAKHPEEAAFEAGKVFIDGRKFEFDSVDPDSWED